MRGTRNALTIGIALLSLAGCGGGGGSDRGSAAAAVNTATPGPIGSGVTPGTPGTPGNNGQLTDALVSSFQMDEVIHVDAATGASTLRWATGNGPTDVATWGNDVYTANTLGQNVTVVDRLANAVVTDIDVTSTPGGLTGSSLLGFLDPIMKPLVRPTGVAVTPNGLKAYSANLLNLTVIDTTTNLPTKSISGLSNINLSGLLGTVIGGLGNPSGIVNSLLQAPTSALGMAKVAATNDVVVATCLVSGKLMRVDARTDQIIDFIDLKRPGGSAFCGPIGVTIARNKAYVACVITQETVVVDLVTGTVLSRIQGGMLPVDVSSSPSEDKVYIANALSGDISVVDTAADIITDTLPAGMNIGTIFNQLASQFGISIPSTSSGGLSGALNAVIQSVVTSLTNPASTGGILSPQTLIGALMSGFMGYMGISQQMLNALNIPALGIFSVSVAHNPIYVCSSNLVMGNVGVTETQTRTVNTLMGLTGIGPADISAVWKR